MRARRCLISAFFTWAQKRHLIPANPFHRLESISVDDHPPAVFTAAESAKVMTECRRLHPQLVPFVALMLFCGLRPSEAAQIAWADVDLERALVNVAGHRAKTRKRRVVTIAPNALEWMRLGGCLPAQNLGKMLSLRRAVGRWGADILRHTAASMMLQRDQDAARVSLQLGNTPQVLFGHYRELVTAAECAAFWSIRP
jgi:integrase